MLKAGGGQVIKAFFTVTVWRAMSGELALQPVPQEILPLRLVHFSPVLHAFQFVVPDLAGAVVFIFVELTLVGATSPRHRFTG